MVVLWNNLNFVIIIIIIIISTIIAKLTFKRVEERQICIFLLDSYRESLEEVACVNLLLLLFLSSSSSSASSSSSPPSLSSLLLLLLLLLSLLLLLLLLLLCIPVHCSRILRDPWLTFGRYRADPTKCPGMPPH